MAASIAPASSLASKAAVKAGGSSIDLTLPDVGAVPALGTKTGGKTATDGSAAGGALPTLDDAIDPAAGDASGAEAGKDATGGGKAVKDKAGAPAKDKPVKTGKPQKGDKPGKGSNQARAAAADGSDGADATSSPLSAYQLKPQDPASLSSGNFTYEVGIDVPAFHGIEPHVSLAYQSGMTLRHSGSGNGWLGVGWSLKGVPEINRVSKGKGTPWFDGDLFAPDKTVSTLA
ncbi:SpvB/TcaC N-terminal domain-containing protein, partial [Oryzibacter oryziterrae]|uniref:SpvB/TcaC N-terminal domain-containing protein n=1 Tax=Oryzibacter oryziterrae TaxID=2766474 RepID=UPI00272BC0BF